MDDAGLTDEYRLGMAIPMTMCVLPVSFLASNDRDFMNSQLLFP
jgi:hypothetical protein